MPLPELWFVYDQTQGDFNVFLNEIAARSDYDARIKEINDDVCNAEYEGDETVYFGRIHAHAQVVPVGINDDTGDEIFDLVSYNCEVKK